jgi:hypothetical protein
VVGHVGTRLLTDLADKTGLTSGFVQALGLDRVRRPAHEPGRVAVDLAVLLADGGEAITDLAALRQQPDLFGRVDRIRTGKTTGFGRFPSRTFAINQAWLELALTGIDLLCWTQHLLLDGAMAVAEPKKLRYRLLHVAGKLSRTARTTTLRIAADWPWTDDLVTAFQRLAAVPEPVT